MIPGQGTKISHTAQCRQKIKKLMGKVKQRGDKEREREEQRSEEERGRLGVGGRRGWRKGGRGRRKEEDADHPKREVLGIREPWV